MKNQRVYILIRLLQYLPEPHSISGNSCKFFSPAILFMALCMSVLGCLWWNLGLQKIGSGKTSLFFNLVPFVTMIISAITGAAVTYPQLFGVGFVILGVLTASGVFPLTPSKTVLTQDGGAPIGK
ncbi:EamA family transporter [Fictibacillus sp. S7]|uniref:EamA family transporter n=1 Tax=Fictibacillus sp. S7 TaxID=2212476 RepID=UPI00101313FA|nr:hypothetical protein DMO16_21400 [Fictibacillus sp. S7]